MCACAEERAEAAERQLLESEEAESERASAKRRAEDERKAAKERRVAERRAEEAARKAAEEAERERVREEQAQVLLPVARVRARVCRRRCRCRLGLGLGYAGAGAAARCPPARLPNAPLRRRSCVLAGAALPVLLTVIACCARLAEAPMPFVCADTHPCGAARL
jgi:hypothetical protein